MPVGVFLLEHILYSNAQAIGGPLDYAIQVKFLGSLPLVFFLELFGIWLPIAFHGLYGLWIWYRGTPNLISYPWAGNWMYSVQRWTGVVAFAYIIVHVYTLRFSGVDLHDNPAAAFGKVQRELANRAYATFYVVGLVSASWHFAYGVWLFCCKWGITTGERARRRLLFASSGLFLLLTVVGMASLAKLTRTAQQPVENATFDNIEQKGQVAPTR